MPTVEGADSEENDAAAKSSYLSRAQGIVRDKIGAVLSRSGRLLTAC